MTLATKYMKEKIMTDTIIFKVYEACFTAINNSVLISRANKQDKEFHFQNWINQRINETGHNFEIGGRNSYPDFRIVKVSEGYEVKGLAYPGREANYDSNSQAPCGIHNGRAIFYVFGRYPATPDGDNYPVLDLVICHGDFLNANHDYVHKNKSIKGFGSYGDIMIRDRKMYVAPTPFGLVSGLAHTTTLILPNEYKAPKNFKCVGDLSRREAKDLIVGYTFDLTTNILTPKTVANPTAGREHLFKAWRLVNESDDKVSMRNIDPKKLIEEVEDDE